MADDKHLRILKQGIAEMTDKAELERVLALRIEKEGGEGATPAL
jgi:hypothetical protein